MPPVGSQLPSRHYPMELDLIKQVTSSFEKGSPEYDSLANLIAGGEPTINKALKK